MNRFAWHYPVGIFISVIAHLGLIVLLTAAARSDRPEVSEPRRSFEPTVMAPTIKPNPLVKREQKMETYPMFQEPVEVLQPAIPAPKEMVSKLRIERIAPPRTIVVEPDEEFPALFE